MRNLTPWTAGLVAVMLAAGLLGPAGGTTVGAHGITEQTMAFWDGRGSTVGEASGVVSNPAALMGLRGGAVRMQAAQVLDRPQPDGYAVIYREPDGGWGAGQLAYAVVADEDDRVTQFVYSGAKPAGSAAAVGLGLTHTRRQSADPADSFSAWALDVGFYGALSEQLAVGAVVRNALLYGDAGAREHMPPSLAAGFALDLGPVTLSGDWLLEGREAPFKRGYVYGVEANLGRLLATFSQRTFVEAHMRYLYYGLGYRFDIGRIDLTVGEGPDGRTLVLGVSLFF